MRKASTALLEQGTQTPSPAPDLIPAESSTENLHWDWYRKRGHLSLPNRRLRSTGLYAAGLVPSLLGYEAVDDAAAILIGTGNLTARVDTMNVSARKR
jgi:hypothetical protein